MFQTLFRLLGAATLLVVIVGNGSAETPTTAAASPGSGPSTSPARTPAKRTHRLVYSCREGNIPVFADRPCGELISMRSLDIYTPEQSGKPPLTVAEPVRAATKPARREAPDRTAEEAAAKCERLQKALDDIDDRMRAGYPARQAAQLWQRWRDARDAVREAHC